MKQIKIKMAINVLGAMLFITMMANRAHAFAHQWDINEIYSNADGTIQFIEMINPTIAIGETLLSGTTFTTNANTYLYPNNLVGNTANKTFLMATSGFAALPGTPTPDYIIFDNFFDPTGDTLTFTPPIPDEIVAFISGDIPLCGTLSMNADLTTGTNSPTNFSDETGPITIVFAPLGDLSGDCEINLIDFALMASNWMVDCLSNPGLPECSP